MNREQWEQVSEVFHRGLALSARERDGLIADQIRDPELAAQLRQLWEHAESTNFLKRPLVGTIQGQGSPEPSPPEFKKAALTSGIAPGRGRAIRIGRNRVISLLGKEPSIHCAPETPSMAGSTISHYEILQKIGEGGMGVVYKAHDTRLERVIALKLLLAEKIADSERRLRFVREAQSASALNHPNIVTVYDVDGTDEFYFIAMEYISGHSLDRLIPRKGMRIPDALRCAIQITDALACAHQAGIVHRDLKPGNVMVSDRGLTKVVDFGLAKLTERTIPPGFTSTQTTNASSESLTEKGYIVGTVAYMSPEQAEDKPIDGRSDIFSMGCLLYEMLTGKRAFQGETKLRTLTAILTHEPQRISELVGNMPPELERIVSRCLKKDRERRFQHMEDLKIALEELKEESDSGKLAISQEPMAASGKRVPLFKVIAPIAAVLFVIAVAGWWFFSKRPAWPSLATLSHPTPVTTYRGTEENATLSPDGKQVAFSGNVEAANNFDIYVKFIDSDPPLRLTRDPAPDETPVWSPNGRWIAFTREGTPDNLFLISPLGGSERIVAQADQLRPQAWSADSHNLLATLSYGPATLNGDLVAISIATGERRQLIKNVESAAISHDGQKLAFVRHDIGAQRGAQRLYVCSLSAHLDISGVRWVAGGKAEEFGGCTWAAGDRSVVCSVRKAISQPPSLWRIDIRNPTLAEVLPFTEGAWDPVISASGDRLVFDVAKVEFDTWEAKNPLLTATSSAPERFASWTRADSVPQYSPDGRRIAFVSFRSGSHQVWTGNPDGSKLQMLTSSSEVNPDTPRWSRDNNSVVFTREHEIYTIDVADGVSKQITSGVNAKVSEPSYSRDGKWIYFVSDRTGRSEIWKVPALGGSARQVTKDGGTTPVESPDGNLFYIKTVDNTYELRSFPAGGGDERRVFTSLGGFFAPPQFAFSRGGLFYIRYENPDLPIVIEHMNLRTGLTKKVITVNRAQRFSGRDLSVSPDGKSLLYSLIDSEDDIVQFENFH